ncbi:leucine-rich repeat domain-containing protein [Crocinitomix catalasitica]|nr:leucine-rich repeat domain-containing protein [Crocinitomix catalasitica]
MVIILLPSYNLFSQKDKIYYSLEEALAAPVDSVYRLDLSKNKLDSLSKEIVKLTRLRELNLEKNKLSSLPENFRFKDLRTVNLAKNKFKKFPEELCQIPSIRQLLLGKNEIAELPECIEFIKNLIVIDLWFNPIESLPEGLTKLRNLRTLDLRNINFNNDFQKLWTEKLSWVKIEFDLGCDCGP